VSRAVDIPVIAGGGAGGPEDFYRAVSEGKADAVMAVSVFHFNICTAEQIKSYLREKGVPVL
jgi:cyclase